MKELRSTESSDWGICSWFPDGDAQAVHPDDLERFASLSPYGKIFREVGREEQYMVLAYGPEKIRVLPRIFAKVEVAPIEIGSKVRPKSHPERLGTVNDINWHFKEKKPFYYLRFGEKVYSRRYWSEELICG